MNKIFTNLILEIFKNNKINKKISIETLQNHFKDKIDTLKFNRKQSILLLKQIKDCIGEDFPDRAFYMRSKFESGIYNEKFHKQIVNEITGVVEALDSLCLLDQPKDVVLDLILQI